MYNLKIELCNKNTIVLHNKKANYKNDDLQFVSLFASLNRKSWQTISTKRLSASWNGQSIITGVQAPVIVSRFRSNISDQNRRRFFKACELKHNIFRSCLASRFGRTLGIAAIDYRRYYKNQYTKNSLTKIRNRCIFTGYSTSIAKLRLSRISVRHLAHSGRISGLTKNLNK